MDKTSHTAIKGSVGKLPQITPLPKIYDGLIEELAKRNGVPELPTGIDELDQIIWGLHRKQLFIIAARPSEGKTALGLQIGWNLADAGRTVFFISLEMSREQLLERLVCNVMSIRNTDLREGKLTFDIKNRMEMFKKLIVEGRPKLLLTDDAGYRYEDIAVTVKRLTPRPDVLILDYIQLCSMGKYNSKLDAISEYVRALKQLAVEYNMAVVVLSQINRGVKERKDRRPLLEELKGSGTLEEHADSVTLLYWPYRNEDNVEDPTLYEVDVAKQRHGPTQKCELRFLPQHFRIESKYNA